VGQRGAEWGKVRQGGAAWDSVGQRVCVRVCVCGVCVLAASLHRSQT
jgi:hypothetical protein